MKKNISMNIITLFATIYCCEFVQAQESVQNAGGNISSADGSISYSIGQVLYIKNTNPNTSVLQGVQQPYEIQTILNLQNSNILLYLAVFPNPIIDKVILKVQNQNFDHLNFGLYDINGRLILKNRIESETTSIDMQQYSKAVYFLKIFNFATEVKTFKIIKN